MNDEDYLIEEAREMWQKHLTLVEGAEMNYMSSDDDATGISGNTTVTIEEFNANDKLTENRLLDLKLARAVAVTQEAYDNGYTLRDVGAKPTPPAQQWDDQTERNEMANFYKALRSEPGSSTQHEQQAATLAEKEQRLVWLDQMTRYINRQSGSMDEALDAAYKLYQFLKDG